MKTAEEMKKITEAVILRKRAEEQEMYNQFLEERLMPLIEKAANDGQRSVAFFLDVPYRSKTIIRMLEEYGYKATYDCRLVVYW